MKVCYSGLVHEEGLYRLLFESNPHPMFIIDRETLFFLAVNNAAILHYGYSREEFMSMTINDIYHPKDTSFFHNESVVNILSENGAAGGWKYRKKGGTVFNAHTTKSPVFFGGREARCFMMYGATLCKQIEQYLGLQYAIVRILVESDTRDKTFRKILRAICEILNWDYGEIWIIDKRANVLRCMEIWYHPFLELSEFRAITQQEVFSQGIGLPGRIWKCSNPLWVIDVVQDTNFSRATIAAKKGLHGAFGFPIQDGKEILGVAVFFNRSIQQPDETLLNLMAALGGEIGQFIKRKEAERVLARTIKFEKAASGISARFVLLSDFDNAVSSSLADAGRFAGATRTRLFQFHSEGGTMDITHEWFYKGITYEARPFQNLPAAMSSWLENTLRDARVIRIPDVSSMSPASVAEKEILEHLGAKSFLAVPVYAEKDLVGFISFENVLTTCEWNEEDINLLYIMAEIIGAAIARKQSEATIKHLAFHDALTNLPNRILFLDRLQMAIQCATRNKHIVAVIFLDLDCFKAVNDSMGHHVGDLLLRAVAERLTGCVRVSDTVSRAGGDEFLIILTDFMYKCDAETIAQKILNSFSNSFQFGNSQVKITASMGISIFPNDAGDTDNLIKRADIAMYLSKEQGKNTYRFYNPELDTHC